MHLTLTMVAEPSVCRQSYTENVLLNQAYLNLRNGLKSITSLIYGLWLHLHYFKYILSGSKGIRQRPVQLMHIPNHDHDHKITPSVDYNQWSKLLKTLTDKPTNPNSIKVSKVVMPTNKKTLSYNFGDQCNKQPIVLPPSLTKSDHG